MSNSTKNLVRMALMGSLQRLGDAVGLLNEDPWLQAHVREDNQLLVDVLQAVRVREGVGVQPIWADARTRQALVDLAQWLDLAGTKVWTRNDNQRDAFDLAVDCGCAGLVAWMGEHGDRPDNLEGRWTARKDLAMLANADTVKSLAKLGFNPNATDKSGNTALHLVRRADMVEALLDVGADPAITNDSGQDVRAYWDCARQVMGDERKAMDLALARFETPDEQRTLQEFSEVVQRQGITQAMHRLALCNIDIATARWQGFTLPEMMVARALNHGLSETPILGTGNIKDITTWFKRCLSVWGHYQKNGGAIDDGIVSAFSMLQRLCEHAKNHSADIHGNIHKSKNEAIRKQLFKCEEIAKEIVPGGRKYLLVEDCAYLDRAVDAGVIKVGSPLAGCLAMAATYTKSQGEGSLKLLERSLLEHWEGQWNAYRFQARGVVSSNRGRYNLIDRVPDIFLDVPPEPGPRTTAIILGIFAAHVASRDFQASWTLLDVAEQSLLDDGCMAQVKDDPLVLGCLAMVDAIDNTQGAQVLGDETLERVQQTAQRMRAMTLRDDMQHSTQEARAIPRGMGRL